MIMFFQISAATGGITKKGLISAAAHSEGLASERLSYLGNPVWWAGMSTSARRVRDLYTDLGRTVDDPELTLDVLTTQRELETMREESQKLEDEIQRTSSADVDLRARAVSTMHDLRDTQSTPQHDPTTRQRELLRGVILVRVALTQGLALRSDAPWYEDPELTDLVLSMDGP